MKTITIGIPAFHAQPHICDCLASIQTQTIRDDISVIIAADDPADNYDFVKDRFPDLDITILPCDSNGGPGAARQRALAAAKTDWITFIDADDVFMGPFAIESLRAGITTPYIIEVQGVFFQEINEPNPQGMRMMPRNDPGHPWVFGRLYNVKYLKQNKIGFGTLRAMEDGEFNWKIRMTVEGSQFMINIIDAPIYLWRTGSEHSITRIGIEENDGVPLYNWSLCQVGATAAAINAIKFCRASNPFNGSITRFTVEQMVNMYFTYVECLAQKPMFADQNLFNAKRFYHLAYKEIENQITDKILSDMYTIARAQHGESLVGIIPEITFPEFMNRIKSEEYRGKEEFIEIRNKLPQWVTDLELKSGVLGSEGYIYCTNEEEEK